MNWSLCELSPRFGSLVGDGAFTTLPVETGSAVRATFTVWRGRILSDAHGATVGFTIEQSGDLVSWDACPGAVQPFDPGQDVESSIELEISKRFLRLRIEHSGGVRMVSHYVFGYLESPE